ncbi:MAG: pentapeptide repeat-containing protein [Cyanobacteria bacterium P01_C01_bin.89]
MAVFCRNMHFKSLAGGMLAMLGTFGAITTAGRVQANVPEEAAEISRMQTLNREMLLRTGACVGCNLRGNDLTGQSLFNAQLRGADLREAILVRVNLRGADLREVDLSGAFLWGSDLTGARLEGARLCGTVMPTGARLDIGCPPPRPVNSVQRTQWGSAAIPVGRTGGWVENPGTSAQAVRAVPAVTGQVVVGDDMVRPSEDGLPQVVMSVDGLRGRARGLLESDGKDIWSIELVPGQIQVRLLGNFLRSRLEILDEDGEVVASGGSTVTWEVTQEGRYGISVQGFRPERPYELAVEIDPVDGFEGEELEGFEEEEDFEVRSPDPVASAPRAASFGAVDADETIDPTIETNESEGEVESTVGPIDPRVTMPVDPVEPRALSLEISTGEGFAEGVVREGQTSTWLVTSRPGELEMAIATEEEEDGARFTVRDPRGRVVAELVKKAEIFVPADGIYEVEIETREEIEIAQYALTVQLK